MDRLTQNNDTQYDLVGKCDTNIEEFTSNHKLRNDLLNKLGQLEDIEEELGIDLITLFKVRQIYWRIKYIDTGEYSDIEKSYRVYLDFQNRDIKVYRDYDEFGFNLDLKDYGKTWALTREELENDR